MHAHFIKKLSHLILFLLLVPSAQAHFTTKGPYGGSVSCLLATDTMIFVGTPNGGVFRTTSSAATSWRYANYSGLTNAAVNSLASIGQHLIAGTNGGIFKSEDAGNSWTVSNNGLSNTTVLSLIAADDHMIAGTNGGGVFLSHDSGSTWEQSNVGLTNLVITGFAFDGITIYAATQAGVFSSVDEGDSWTAMNTGLVDLAVKAITVSGNNIFIANAGGIFVTSNAAINWSPNNMGIDTVINSLSASNGIVYAATQSGIYSSPDQNILWTAENSGYSGNTTSIAVYGGKLFAGTKEDGIYRSLSLSSVAWTEFNTGFNNLETYALYNSGTLVITATNKGLFVSNDLAANYARANNGLTDSLHITSLTIGGGKLYVSTQNAGVFVSSDTGRTWTQANTGLSSMNIQKLIATDTYIYAASVSGKVFNTLLSTINWSATSGLPSGIIPTSFATDGVSHVFLGTQTQGVFMCMDNENWTVSNSGLTNLNITSMVVSGTTLYAGTNGGGVFKRELMGTWSAANTGLPTLQITSLGAAGQWVVAGFKGGIYLTYDDGNSWKAPDITLYIPEFADITAISFTSASTRIFIATPYNCLYSNGIGELPTGLQSITQEPGNISVFPNPNNGNFIVDLGQVNARVTRIAVYDLTGNLLYQSGSVGDGYKAAVSLRAPSPGIYFVNIQTDRGSVSQKVFIR